MKKGKIVLISGFLLIFVIIGITLLLSFGNDKNVHEYEVYYINQITKTLDKEIKKTSIQDNNGIIQELLNKMSIPQSQSYRSVFSSEVDIENFKMSTNAENILNIYLSKSYNNLDDVSKIYLETALVWSLTSLDFVDGIFIYVDGKQIQKNSKEFFGVLNRENVVLNPVISPDSIDIRIITLYFANSDYSKLVKEIRNVEVKQNQNVETMIVEQLISGPVKSENKSIIPSETKIKNVKTEDGICYVDFSYDFFNKFMEKGTEELKIYSIINSLTELSNVNKVRFLIEGEKVSENLNGIDLSKAFERDESLISKE